MKQLLSLRLSRRAVGAAILDAGGLKTADTRHLRSNSQEAVAAAIAFIDRLLEDSSITAVAIDRPLPGSSTVGDAVSAYLATSAAARGMQVLLVAKLDILTAYGVATVRTRGDVRSLVAAYWPLLSEMRRPHPHTLDAAAAALYAECQLTLSPPRT